MNSVSKCAGDPIILPWRVPKSRGIFGPQAYMESLEVALPESEALFRLLQNSHLANNVLA
jgi:hypothetical protein